MKGWEKIFHVNRNQKTADKTHFKAKTETRKKEYYIMIKESIHQGDVIIINVFAYKLEHLNILTKY